MSCRTTTWCNLTCIGFCGIGPCSGHQCISIPFPGYHALVVVFTETSSLAFPIHPDAILPCTAMHAYEDIPVLVSFARKVLKVYSHTGYTVYQYQHALI